MDNNIEVRNRLQEALSLRNMKAVELCEKTQINKASISNWISQRWQPKATPLHKMAMVLDVSELWLAGYNVPMERPDRQKKMDQLADSILKIKGNDRYTQIVNKLVRLNEDQLSLVENLMSQLIKD